MGQLWTGWLSMAIMWLFARSLLWVRDCYRWLRVQSWPICPELSRFTLIRACPSVAFYLFDSKLLVVPMGCSLPILSCSSMILITLRNKFEKSFGAWLLTIDSMTVRYADHGSQIRFSVSVRFSELRCLKVCTQEVPGSKPQSGHEFFALFSRRCRRFKLTLIC